MSMSHTILTESVYLFALLLRCACKTAEKVLRNGSHPVPHPNHACYRYTTARNAYISYPSLTRFAKHARNVEVKWAAPARF